MWINVFASVPHVVVFVCFVFCFLHPFPWFRQVLFASWLNVAWAEPQKRDRARAVSRGGVGKLEAVTQSREGVGQAAVQQKLEHADHLRAEAVLAKQWKEEAQTAGEGKTESEAKEDKLRRELAALQMQHGQLALWAQTLRTELLEAEMEASRTREDVHAANMEVHQARAEAERRQQAAPQAALPVKLEEVTAVQVESRAQPN